MSVSLNYPCFLIYQVFDNEGVCRHEANGIVESYTDDTIYCRDTDCNCSFVLTVCPEGGWISSIDEYDRYVDVYPHPDSTPEEYRIIEDILCMNDHLC